MTTLEETKRLEAIDKILTDCEKILKRLDPKLIVMAYELKEAGDDLNKLQKGHQALLKEVKEQLPKSNPYAKDGKITDYAKYMQYLKDTDNDEELEYMSAGEGSR